MVIVYQFFGIIESKSSMKTYGQLAEIKANSREFIGGESPAARGRLEMIHRMTRRCFGWDYRQRAIYQMTLVQADRARPLLGRLFPAARRDRETMQALSANVSANLLGLGNAATPAGIQAALRLKELSGTDRASNELCRLVVMNTASVQLLPTTVAALRSAAGAADAFDILPAVWISSAASVCVGLLAARLMEGRT